MTETIDNQLLVDVSIPDSELFKQLDLLVAQQLLTRDELSRADSRTMEARLCVSRVMRETLANMFEGYTLFFRDLESSADADFEVMHSFLLNFFYDSLLGVTNNLDIVCFSNDIFDVISNGRDTVTLCPVVTTGYQCVLQRVKETRLRLNALNRMLSGTSSGRPFSMHAYDKYESGHEYFTTLNAGRSFDIGVHDCCHSQLNQFELAILAQGFGLTRIYFNIPYLPEVLLSQHRSGEYTLPEYGLAYRFDRESDELVIRSINSDYINMRYGLREYSDFLLRSTLLLGPRMALFEAKRRVGRFLYYTMDLVRSDDIDLSSEELIHSVTLPFFEENVLFKRYSLKSHHSDPSKSSNYSFDYFSAPVDAIRSVRSFAATTPQKSFTPRAVRRRLANYCQRRIVNGTTLTFSEFVDADQLTALVNYIYAEAFIERYYGGETFTELNKELSKLMESHSRGILRSMIAYSLRKITGVYDFSFGRLFDFMRRCLANSIMRRVDTSDPREIMLPESLIIVEPTVQIGMSEVGNAMPRVYELSQGTLFQGQSSIKSVWDFIPRKYPRNKRVTAVRVNTVRAGHERVYNKEFFDVISEKVERGEDIVHAPDTHGLETLTPAPLDDAEASDPIVKIDAYAQVINEAYREIYPDQQRYPMTVNQMIFEISDYAFSVTSPYYEIRPILSRPYKERHYHESTIKAAGELPVQQTQRSIMQAVGNRQIGPPDIDEGLDLGALGNEELLNVVMRRFFASFCVEEWETLLAAADPAYFARSYESLAAKLSRTEPHKIEKWLKFDGDFRDLRQNYMRCMIKSIKKPPDADGGHLKVDKSQSIIMDDEPAVSVELSALLSACLDLFRSLLRPNVLWMDRKKPINFAEVAQTYDPYDDETSYVEADISKCDKSFKKYSLIVIIDELIRLLRMHWLVRYKWYQSMDETLVRAIDAGIRFILTDQIKSGFFITWFGNTAAIQVATANAIQLFDVDTDRLPSGFDVPAWFKSKIELHYPKQPLPVIPRYHYAFATGDDGLLAMRSVLDSGSMIMLQERMSKLYNLEVKVIQSRWPYFASGYLLNDRQERRSYFVPNPAKLIEKKSYAVPADNAQWREFWISMGDAMEQLSSARTRQLLCDAVQGRTSKSLPTLRDAIEALYSISQSYEEYISLYNQETTLL